MCLYIHCAVIGGVIGLIICSLILQDEEGRKVCTICGKSYIRKQKLLDHIRADHWGQKYMCDFENCGKMLKTKASLRLHEKIHQNTFKYICPYCKKGFNHKVHYGYHINCHENQRNFKCPKCDKGFNNSKNVVRHLKFCGIPKMFRSKGDYRALVVKSERS